MMTLIRIFTAQGEPVRDAELHVHVGDQVVATAAFDAERQGYLVTHDGLTRGSVKASHPVLEMDDLRLPIAVEAIDLRAGARGDAYTVFQGRRCFYRVLEGHLAAVLAARRPADAEMRALEEELALQRLPGHPVAGGVPLDDSRIRLAYRLSKNSPSIASVLQRLRVSGFYEGVGELRMDGSMHEADVRVVTGQEGLDWLIAQNFDPKPMRDGTRTYSFTMSTGQELKSDTLWKKMARTDLFESFWQVPI
jgi:hypothetical protein